MTDPEVEDLLRETFRDREAQAPPLSRVRRKRRRTPALAAAGLATLAVLAGAIVAANALRSPAPPTVDIPTAAGDAPATGWRWESSLGAEIQVPDTWKVNEYGCGSPAPPSVHRGDVGGRALIACIPPNPQEIATITGAPITQSPNARPIEVDGVPALRHEWTEADGRFNGTVTVASRDVVVEVRTLNKALTSRILDSVRLVGVDHLGCSASIASAVLPAPASALGKPTVPSRSTKLVICLYAQMVRLQSSIEVNGAVAQQIFMEINAAKPGPNPDPAAGQCTADPPKAPDLVLWPDGGPALSVVFSGCTGRGITDGQTWSRVTKQLIGDLMTHTFTGWGYYEPLD